MISGGDQRSDRARDLLGECDDRHVAAGLGAVGDDREDDRLVDGREDRDRHLHEHGADDELRQRPRERLGDGADDEQQGGDQDEQATTLELVGEEAAGERADRGRGEHAEHADRGDDAGDLAHRAGRVAGRRRTCRTWC